MYTLISGSTDTHHPAAFEVVTAVVFIADREHQAVYAIASAYNIPDDVRNKAISAIEERDYNCAVYFKCIKHEDSTFLWSMQIMTDQITPNWYFTLKSTCTVEDA